MNTNMTNMNIMTNDQWTTCTLAPDLEQAHTKCDSVQYFWKHLSVPVVGQWFDAYIYIFVFLDCTCMTVWILSKMHLRSKINPNKDLSTISNST